MSPHGRLLLLGAAVALAVGLAGLNPAGAEPPGPAQPAPVATPASPPSPVSAAPGQDASAVAPGLRAFIDPETGTLGPPVEMPALAPADGVTPPAAQAVLTVLPDGSEMLELNGTIEDYTIIQLDANGRQVVRCVEDPKAAAQTLPPAPQREDR